ncbi:hypothetical protein CPY51_07335 [Rhizobium tubonense]|uniref:Uncharacterized protein n=1 Tax=Rhizobium tubonense TaxID=484088 RepID=A0A2W4CZ56_9HYPH|nr:hypothetical protein CPY51_07335 [Rhizobium tubonense]
MSASDRTSVNSPPDDAFLHSAIDVGVQTVIATRRGSLNELPANGDGDRVSLARVTWSCLCWPSSAKRAAILQQAPVLRCEVQFDLKGLMPADIISDSLDGSRRDRKIFWAAIYWKLSGTIRDGISSAVGRLASCGPDYARRQNDHLPAAPGCSIANIRYYVGTTTKA